MNKKNTTRTPPSLLIKDDSVASAETRRADSLQAYKLKALPSLRRSRYLAALIVTLITGTAVIMTSTFRAPYSALQTPSPAAFSAPIGDVSFGTITADEPLLTQPSSPETSSALIVNTAPAAAPSPQSEIDPAPHSNARKTTSLPASPSVKAQPHLVIRTPEKTEPSSDIDVLIALMRYSEDGRSSARLDLQDRLDKCPPPNTRSGIQCRQQICAQPGGEKALCPEKP